MVRSICVCSFEHLRKKKMKPEPEYVPGTRRQRVTTKGGVELQRQWVYLDQHTWNSLRGLAAAQGVSGSIVISQLIKIASRHHGKVYQ